MAPARCSSTVFCTCTGTVSLYRDGILKRKVYDHIPLQRLLNDGAITEAVDAQTLRVLLERGVIPARLAEADVGFLRKFGIFNDRVCYRDGDLVMGETVRVPADLERPESYAAVVANGLGDRLQGGILMHGGFFMGPQDFYEALRTLPERAAHAARAGKPADLHDHGAEDQPPLRQRRTGDATTAVLASSIPPS